MATHSLKLGDIIEIDGNKITIKLVWENFVASTLVTKQGNRQNITAFGRERPESITINYLEQPK